MMPRAQFRIAASVVVAILGATFVSSSPAGASSALTRAALPKKVAKTTKKSTKAAPTTTVPVTTAPTTTVPPATPPPTPTVEFSNSCASDVECATVQVPLDPTDPTGEKVGLFVTRRRARNTAARIGALFINPGGPGAPTFDLVRNAQLIVSAEVLDRFDIIGVDPRGTSRSSPITCSVGGESAGTATRESTVRSVYTELARACGTVEGRRLDYLDTPTAARDLDAVRVALGEERISFLGLSYGTYLGAVYESLFPTHSARIILDSAITPSHFGGFMFLDRAAAKEIALDGFLLACANGQLNPCAFNDGSDLKAKYVRVRSGWITTAGRTSERIFDSQIDAMVGYPRNGWPVLGRALQEIVTTGRPNFAQLPSDSQTRDERDRIAPTDNFSELTNLAINCRDGILPRDSATYDAITQQLPSIAPRFVGIASSFALAALTCVDWPAAVVAPPTFRPLGVPTLVIANRFDLTTPLLWSQTLAGDLTAPLLVREGGGHVAVDKSECVRNIVARFLIDAVPGLVSNSCPS
jgi:pimeloyl-ACP methyl ester carboxylesterase